ncbi:cytidine deaminase-like protein [Nemania sp. NC0429]|nr:cytidine deaminase-like protein [Nemania sp. NC0429]
MSIGSRSMLLIMLLFGGIFHIFVGVVLFLSRQSEAGGPPLYNDMARMVLSRTARELLRPSIEGSNQLVISESLQPEEVPDSPQAIPLSTREHWMRRANAALSDLVSPCPFAAFGSVIVNHSDTSSSPFGRLICVGVNSQKQQGNPILHGEIDAINRCSNVLQSPPFDLNPKETTLAFRDLTLYTNGEPCPMCASAIRWAGFRECVYGTSIETMVRLGWDQIGVPSQEIFARSELLSTTTALIPDVLAAETDPFFSWQFDANAPCPESCVRDNTGKCVPAE